MRGKRGGVDPIEQVKQRVEIAFATREQPVERVVVEFDAAIESALAQQFAPFDFIERLQHDLRARGQSRGEIRQAKTELRRRRARGEQQRRVFGTATVVEVEQRVLGSTLADNRVDVIDRQQVAAAETQIASARGARKAASGKYCALRPPSFAAAQVATSKCVRPLPDGPATYSHGDSTSRASVRNWDSAAPLGPALNVSKR